MGDRLNRTQTSRRGTGIAGYLSRSSRCAQSGLQTAFQAIGRHLPTVWQQGRVSQRHKKALLRALIDKVVVHRLARDRVQARIVWKGGDTTTLSIPVPVRALKDLAGAQEMERLILERSEAFILDEVIAQELTELGYRSPLRQVVLPSTVKSIRLKHRQFLKRSQSHPRRIEGALTISQIALALDIDPHWIYDRIHNGTIQVDKDPKTRLFLFPDQPETIEQFKLLRAGSSRTCVFRGASRCMIEATFDIRVKHVFALLVDITKDCCNRIVSTASRSETIAVGLKRGFPLGSRACLTTA